MPERFMMQFHNDLQPCKSDTSVYHTAYIHSNSTENPAELRILCNKNHSCSSPLTSIVVFIMQLIKRRQGNERD